jgi:hypothetical protein
LGAGYDEARRHCRHWHHGHGDDAQPRFLDKSREELMQLLRLNTAAHLDIARHFGERLVRRGSGGLMFVGAMGADKGSPNALVSALCTLLNLRVQPSLLASP